MKAEKFHVQENVVFLNNAYVDELARCAEAVDRFEKTYLKIFRERAERAVDAAWERNNKSQGSETERSNLVYS
jgi:hypothetical protein